MKVVYWILFGVAALLAVVTLVSLGLGMAFDSELWLARARRFRGWLWLQVMFGFNFWVWGNVAYTLWHWNKG